MKLNEKELCPECGKITIPEIVEKTVNVTVRKDEFAILVKRAICANCHAEYGLDDREFDENAIAYDSYRKKHNLLFPEDIVKIREKYGLNQKSFSRLIGSGENTIHIYEKGGLQDGTHNEMIKTASNPEVMKDLYEDNTDAVTPDIKEKFEERLAVLLEEKNKNKMREIVLASLGFKQDILCGFKKFDIDYFVNFMLLILSYHKPLSTTHMGKIPCYIDFLKFKETSVSFTGCRYKIGDYGPFLDNYNKLFCYLKDCGAVESVIDPMGYGETYYPVKTPDMSLFSAADAALIKEVTTKLGPLTAKALSDKTHKEFPGWDKKRIGEPLSFENAKNVTLL